MTGLARVQRVNAAAIEQFNPQTRHAIRMGAHEADLRACKSEAQGANGLQPDETPAESRSLHRHGEFFRRGVRPVRMHFSYNSEFGAYTPEAYERRLLETVAGDAALFIRRDEVETAWTIVDSIRHGWEGKPLSNREFYAAGTWGPMAAEELLAQSGHFWPDPKPAK